MELPRSRLAGFASARLIDVSQDMGAFRFPGNPPVEARGPFSRVEGPAREYVYDLTLCTQSGTHVQGPHYFLPEGERIDAFPLEASQGEATVLDLKRRGADTTGADLEAWLSAEERDLPALILRTGHMEEVIAAGRLDPARRPGLSLDAALFLAERTRIRLVGIDSVGLESRVTRAFEVNRLLGSRGFLILEGLVNLGALSRRRVHLEAFPLRIRGVEGTPCRAVVREFD
jgi:arylformamidase